MQAKLKKAKKDGRGGAFHSKTSGKVRRQWLAFGWYLILFFAPWGGSRGAAAPQSPGGGSDGRQHSPGDLGRGAPRDRQTISYHYSWPKARYEYHKLITQGGVERDIYAYIYLLIFVWLCPFRQFPKGLSDTSMWLRRLSKAVHMCCCEDIVPGQRNNTNKWLKQRWTGEVTLPVPPTSERFV